MTSLLKVDKLKPLNLQILRLVLEKLRAMFSLEMSGEQLVQRMLASEGLIDSQHLRTGQLDQEEWHNLVMAAGSLAGTDIFIDDTPGIKMSEIRAKSRRLAKEKGNLGLAGSSQNRQDPTRHGFCGLRFS